MSDNSDNPPTNGVVLINAQILKHGVSSSADAKIGALFANSRKAIPARTMLMEMGHKQPPTPAQTDNTTTLGFATKPCNQNMQNWWLWDRKVQNQFRLFFGPGKDNKSDYSTKHFCPAHHKQIRQQYLTRRIVLDALRKLLRFPPHNY